MHPPAPARATGWKLHTPNALVWLRLVLAGAFFAMLSLWSPDPQSDADPMLLAAAGLFIIAAFTDAADGYLARRWNAITRFGRVMDPFADKILVLGALVLLAGPGFDDAGTPLAGFTGWMVVVIIARELLVTSLRGLAEGSGIDASANWSGKAKMILQSVAVPAVLLSIALLDPPMDQRINAGLAWATTIVTALSAWPYVTRAIAQGKTA
ncbi:MAG: CDP-diacylglycerol--glycerol-3-phosphate 3-phosphatidyltransferase [Planctomycetota bacterium]